VGREITAVEPLTSPLESQTQLRIMLTFDPTEAVNDRPFVGGMWYDTDEVLEIIEQLPPDARRDAQ